MRRNEERRKHMGELTLKQWMGLQEITIKELAEKSNISETTIVNIRKGKVKPNINTLQKIAAVLNVRVDEILL